MPECQNLIRGTLRYQGFPKFVKVLVNLGFLNDESVAFLAASAPEIAWKDVLQKLTGAKSSEEADLISACIEKGKIPADSAHQIISGLRWYTHAFLHVLNLTVPLYSSFL